jgi:hypothetical protein
MNAAQMGYNGALGNSNAQAASNANMYNGLFGLGNAAIQNPSAVSGAYDWLAKQYNNYQPIASNATYAANDWLTS